jgi:hypothetical protein
MAGEIGGDDSEHNHQRIDDIEIAPLDRQVDDGAGPVAPIELIFLEDVNALGGGCQP